MPHPKAKVHRMFELVEPIAAVAFSEVPNEAFPALGMGNYSDGYFAARTAPLGLAPAGVVHTVFDNFADGEVARHGPWVRAKATPQEAIAVRERGNAATLQQMIDELAGSSRLVRSPTSPPERRSARRPRGRALYAGHPRVRRVRGAGGQALARRDAAGEHRGAGHNAALLTHGIGGVEAHVVLALSLGRRRRDSAGFTTCPRRSWPLSSTHPAYDVLRGDEFDEHGHCHRGKD